MDVKSSSPLSCKEKYALPLSLALWLSGQQFSSHSGQFPAPSLNRFMEENAEFFAFLREESSEEILALRAEVSVLYSLIEENLPETYESYKDMIEAEVLELSDSASTIKKLKQKLATLHVALLQGDHGAEDSRLKRIGELAHTALVQFIDAADSSELNEKIQNAKKRYTFEGISNNLNLLRSVQEHLGTREAHYREKAFKASQFSLLCLLVDSEVDAAMRAEVAQALRKKPKNTAELWEAMTMMEYLKLDILKKGRVSEKACDYAALLELHMSSREKALDLYRGYPEIEKLYEKNTVSTGGYQALKASILAETEGYESILQAVNLSKQAIYSKIKVSEKDEANGVKGVLDAVLWQLDRLHVTANTHEQGAQTAQEAQGDLFPQEHSMNGYASLDSYLRTIRDLAARHMEMLQLVADCSSYKRPHFTDTIRYWHANQGELDQEIERAKKELAELPTEAASLPSIDAAKCVETEAKNMILQQKLYFLENYDSVQLVEILDSSREEIDKLRNVNSKLKKDLKLQNELKRKVKDLNALCSEKEKTIAELKSELQKLGYRSKLARRESKQEKDNLLQTVLELSANAPEHGPRVETELAAQDTALSRVTRELQSSNEELGKLKGENSKLKKQLAKLEKHYNEQLQSTVSKESKSLVNSKREFEFTISNLNGDIEGLQDRLGDSKSMVDQLLNANNVLEEENLLLYDEIDGKEVAIVKLNQEHEEIMKLREENSHLHESFNRLLNETQDLENVNVVISQLEQELEKSHFEEEESKVQLEKLGATNIALEEENEHILHEIETISAKHREALTDLQDYATIKEENQEKCKFVEESGKNLENLNEKLKEKLATCSSLEKRVQVLTEKAAAYNENILELATEKNTLLESVKKLKTELELCQIQSNEFQKKSLQYKKKIDEFQVKMSAVSSIKHSTKPEPSADSSTEALTQPKREVPAEKKKPTQRSSPEDQKSPEEYPSTPKSKNLKLSLLERSANKGKSAKK